MAERGRLTTRHEIWCHVRRKGMFLHKLTEAPVVLYTGAGGNHLVVAITSSCHHRARVGTWVQYRAHVDGYHAQKYVSMSGATL